MPHWIVCDGTVNTRDVGGLSGPAGAIQPGRLWRSDNLQDLSDADVERLCDGGLTDVVDLRSDVEVTAEGPGPLRRTGVGHHHFNFFPDSGAAEVSHGDSLPGENLPWQTDDSGHGIDDPIAASYATMVRLRPDSIAAALRTIADADGATLVHCAAGKDRTGITIAYAADLCDVERDQIVDDYHATDAKVEQIIARLVASPTYRAALTAKGFRTQAASRETMAAFLEWTEARGGVRTLLGEHFSDDDHARLRERLLT